MRDISTEITKEYYNIVKNMENNGTTDISAYKVLRKNGTHEYYTYHLVK